MKVTDIFSAEPEHHFPYIYFSSFLYFCLAARYIYIKIVGRVHAL